MNCDTETVNRLLIWWDKLRTTTSPTFYPLFGDTRRYLVLMGGAGSGKSIFAGRKVIERCACEPGHRMLVVRKVARTLRESCFQQLVNQARDYYPELIESINRTDMGIRFKNGSEILFTGLDDVEKLKSIYSITGIWIEEASELLESDFNQLDIRLRGETPYYKQIIITFNPISLLHWLKRRFFDTPDDRTKTHHSTYKDNKFLDEDSKRVLESYKDTDEYYYTVYCLGQWGVTGKSVFPAKLIQERLSLNIQPIRIGVFEDGRFADADDGFIKVYKEPVERRHYVIGGDTAGEGSDRFVAQVLDNLTGEQVAVLRSQFDEDLFAKQIYCLGKWYNDALIGIEANFSTYPIMELERLNYPHQYVRQTIDEYTHKIQPRYGFRTDSKTRPVIISGLIKAVREHSEDFNDKDTLEEMLTFVRNESYRAEAEDGAHDDCVMALAIAEHIRGQQDVTDAPGKYELMKWTKDMWEDYENANESMRQMLIERWGHPKAR